MEKVWAPWRIDYIRQPKEGECFLCEAFSADEDRENHVLLRGETCAIVINKYPYNSGHLMIAPYRHVDSLEGMTEEEMHEMMELTIQAKQVLTALMKPQGFNLGINLGDVAGAGLKDHIHMHVVPRWQGDTNYMPVIANTKVLPQSLLDLWDELRSVLTDS